MDFLRKLLGIFLLCAVLLCTECIVIGADSCAGNPLNNFEQQSGFFGRLISGLSAAREDQPFRAGLFGDGFGDASNAVGHCLRTYGVESEDVVNVFAVGFDKLKNSDIGSAAKDELMSVGSKVYNKVAKLPEISEDQSYEKATLFLLKELEAAGIDLKNGSPIYIKISKNPSLHWVTLGAGLLIPESDMQQMEQEMSEELKNQYRFMIAHQCGHIAEHHAIESMSAELVTHVAQKTFQKKSNAAFEAVVQKIMRSEEQKQEDHSISQKIGGVFLNKGKELLSSQVNKMAKKVLAEPVKKINEDNELAADRKIRLDADLIQGGLALLKRVSASKRDAASSKYAFESGDQCLSDPQGKRCGQLNQLLVRAWAQEHAQEQQKKSEQESPRDNWIHEFNKNRSHATATGAPQKLTARL